MIEANGVAPARDDFVVRAEALCKDYSGHQVLDGVDLKVARGDFLVLLGPSGSGKTTLLRCLAGTERLSSGSLWLDGQQVAGAGIHLPPERRGLSMVFQEYALWPHLTVLENVAFAVRRLQKGAAERHSRARQTLERVGLAHLADAYPTRLSGGQQQRVALARALAASTPLLLCDEPLSNLDAHLREQVRVEIATLSRDSGATVVYITHDQQEAFALADQVAVINDGRIVQLGTPETVYRQPATRFVATFTGVAGSVPGQIVGRRANGLVQVRCLGATLEAKAAILPARGDEVELLIRGDAVALDEPRSDGSLLLGVVRDNSFRSGAYDHVVDLDGGHRLTGVSSADRVPRGRHVGIRVDAVGCLAFAVESQSLLAPCAPAGVAVDATAGPLRRAAADPAIIPPL